MCRKRTVSAISEMTYIRWRCYTYPFIIILRKSKVCSTNIRESTKNNILLQILKVCSTNIREYTKNNILEKILEVCLDNKREVIYYKRYYRNIFSMLRIRRIFIV